MLAKLPESSGNVLGYAISGSVTEADYEALARDIQAQIARGEQVRMLVDYTAFGGVELAALDEDLRMARFIDHFERFAVVSDRRLFGWLTAVADAVMGLKIRHFEPGDMQAAWAWLRGA